MSVIRKVWQRGRDLLPIDGFHFDRPIIVLQSDDWGRAGLRDHEGLNRLRSARFNLGERPYDFYTLETNEDLAALQAMLARHCDAIGRNPSLGMNFIVANLDLERMQPHFQQIHLLPLADGLPQGWNRPGLLEAYRTGIESGVFCPAVHGVTHFCRASVEREFLAGSERALLLRTIWQTGTPYIHWRAPWIGYEYWDPQRPADERFLPAEGQTELIGQAVGLFTRMFSTLPQSACAPGYRADDETHRAWSRYGIRVAQNGPGTLTPPHLDRYGLLNLYRNVEFEPATDEFFSLDDCIRKAESCFAVGIPAIVSVHSINFHSSVNDFRGPTVRLLDQFLSALEARHPDLLYLHDNDLYQLVENGSYQSAQSAAKVNVTRKKFTRHRIERQEAGQ